MQLKYFLFGLYGIIITFAIYNLIVLCYYFSRMYKLKKDLDVDGLKMRQEANDKFAFKIQDALEKNDKEKTK